ncbi:TRAP transporter small permease [Tissierellaceae bacterium HCP3S3_D8]
MQKKSKVKIILSNLEEIISGGFLIITTILVILNVILRYFLKSGIYWSEEVATGCFVWSVFIGAAAGYKRNQHIGVDFLVDKLSDKYRGIVTTIVNIILTIVNGYLSYLSVIYLSNSYVKPTPVLGISSVYISSALSVSFILMTIYSIIFLYKDISKKDRKGV